MLISAQCFSNFSFKVVSKIYKSKSKIKPIMDKKADVLLEVSWEVCNKVGGIFTVVKSKAAKMVEAYGESYFLVGPYFASKAIAEFQEEMPGEFFKQAFEELKKYGILCHFGKWLIEGSPSVIL